MEITNEGDTIFHSGDSGPGPIAGGDLEGDAMSTYPPDGWTLAAGTWGVDVDVNTTFANRIGDSCIEFLPTTPAGAPVIQLATPVPIEAGKPYKVDALVQADSVAAGNVVTLRINWYDADKAYIGYDSAYAAVVPSINEWHELSGIFNAPMTPTRAQYASPRFAKQNTAFTAYLDWLAIAEMQRDCLAYLASNQTGVASGDAVQIDTEDHDFGSMFDNATYYAWVCPADGVYDIRASVRAAATAGNWIRATLKISTNGGSSWSTITGSPKTIVPTGETDNNAPAQYAGYFARGTLIRVVLDHNEGGTTTVYGSGYTWISVSEQ